MAQERTIIKLAVTKKGHGELKRLADRYGMKDYIVAGRIYEWFGQQDDVFQRAVLGLLEGLERDAAREFMRRMGEPQDVLVKGTMGGKAKKSSPAQAQGETQSSPTPAPHR